MKYQIAYPDLPILMNTYTEECKQFYLDTAKEMNAVRIWLAPERAEFYMKDRSEALAKTRKLVDYFHENGMEVGYWITTIGFRGPVQNHGQEVYERTKDWARLTAVTGIDFHGEAYCPTDPDFCALIEDYFKDICTLGVDLIMIDDEFALSVSPGLGCFCKNHRKRMENILGEELVMEELPEKIFTGGKNRYRDAWYKVTGDSELEFCALLRKTVDTVNPNIRLGVCAGYTSWDIEGGDVIQRAKVLAGNTKPFFRFTSAPYWCSYTVQNHPGQTLNSIIEFARAQNIWSKNEDVEVFAENDTFPRPAYHTAATLAEQFELAMQADGVRSLKYVFDYFSSPEYEPRYIQMHKRNMPLYQKIRDAFGDKQDTGVRLFYPMHTIQNRVLPDKFLDEMSIMRMIFSKSAAMITGLGIPVCYEGAATCAAAFGEEAHYIDDLSLYKKVILDLPAARILAQKGIDVGLAGWEKTAVPGVEVFGRERVQLFGTEIGTLINTADNTFRVELKDGAVVESTMESGEGSVPGSYRYNNGCTEFLVLAFDAQAVGEDSSLFRSYCRQQQLMDFAENAFPVIKKHPRMYSLCAASADGNTHAVLFENLGNDPAFDYAIELGRPCKDFTLTGAEGKLSEDRTKILVSQDFAPHSALLLEVHYL